MADISLSKHWLPVIICALFIFVASSASAPSDIELFPQSDKAAHILMYALFSYLIIRALIVSRPDINIHVLAITSFTAAFSYGIIIEIYQYTLPARSMEAMDILSNGLGALAGVMLFRRVSQKGKKWRK